jgi:hypothetical protein
MRIQDDFFSRGRFAVGEGSIARFWEDVWLGDIPLAQQYPSLYNIIYRKYSLVASVLAQTPLNITFRRALNDFKWNEWLYLCRWLMLVQLTDASDIFRWELTDYGLFTVKSMYLNFMNDRTRFLCKYIWKMKIQLKIKIFM